MTILTPEAMALLKRMDAEEALQKAVELGLEAAIRICNNNQRNDGDEAYDSACRDCATLIGDLKATQ